MIHLELYRIFFVVAEAKNMTRASEILNISQPAITKHIKNLEDQLGNPLFIRTKKGVVLNEYGKQIFLYVKQALTLLDEAERNISRYQKLNKGTIKIGISTTLTKKYLLKYIKDFHNRYPNIQFDIDTDPTKALIEKLKHGNIDFIISKFPKQKDLDLELIPLGETTYIFVGNEQYAHLANHPISLKELQQYPLLVQKALSNSRDSINQYFKQQEITLTPTMNIASSNLLIDFLKIGYGIGYVTKLYVEDDLKDKNLFELNVTPETEHIKYGVITLKRNILSSPCHTFIKYLKEATPFSKEENK